MMRHLRHGVNYQAVVTSTLQIDPGQWTGTRIPCG